MSDGTTTVVGEFLRFIANAVVVAVGWLIVHRQAADRDIAKARRDALAHALDAIGNDVSKVFEDARRYHLGQRDTEVEIRIKMTLQEISVSLAGLVVLVSPQDQLRSCQAAIVELRKSVTGSHFEDEHLSPLEDGDPQLQRVAEAMLQARRRLRDLKHRQLCA